MEYYTGYATGYSAGYVAMRDQASTITSCNIFALPRREPLKAMRSDIYAVSQWVYERLERHPFSTNDITKATYMVATYEDVARAVRVARESNFPLHRLVLLDFAPGCRRIESELIHRVRLETTGCRARPGYDILAPHSASSLPLLRLGRPVRRDVLISFWGHLSKPYIDPPRSRIRYLLWKAMRDEPDCDVGAYDVSTSVNELTTTDATRLCEVCSYRCKTCYLDSSNDTRSDSPRLSHSHFLKKMQQSRFCIAARGDNPGSPKLGEAIVSGCIPLIVMDQRLPFERQLNYSAFSIRVDVDDVLRDPTIPLRLARSVDRDHLATMQRNLRIASSFFDYHSNPLRPAAQDALLDDICTLP